VKVAALMPTRNRAASAARAISTFIAAVSAVEPDASIRFVAADDSDIASESEALRSMAADMAAHHPLIALEVLPPPSSSATRTIAGVGCGPGAVRNRALGSLRSGPDDHDVLFFLDDDVCFTDVDYRGRRLRCDGPALLTEALGLLKSKATVVGCDYLGRQDLSVLEHIRLDTGGHSPMIEPATERADVDNVAPGGISTAFLAIAAPARRLPDLPLHYNEDYVWLHALRRAGWPLRQVSRRLPHVPPGSVEVGTDLLAFQFFGEVVWLAVLEQERFPKGDARMLAAAIHEISGDIEDALADKIVLRRCGAVTMLREVRSRYERVKRRILCEHPDVEADCLRRAIESGLALRPLD
jgi:hypothetical protein